MLEHRVVDGVVVGYEAVHHRNHVTHDNRRENLEPITRRAHGRHHRPDQFDHGDAARMYESGMSTKEIGRALGVHHVSVLRAIRDEGVKMRPPGLARAEDREKLSRGLHRHWADHPERRDAHREWKAHEWASLSPEERAARGEAISRGRLAGIARRKS